MNDIQHRAFPAGNVSLEERADGSRVIVGYGAVFYREGDPGTEYELWDGAVERVDRNAFRAALDGEDDVRGLFNHDASMLLGRSSTGTMRLSVDDIGLRYEIDVPDTQLGRDVVKMLERGDLSGSSFSFRPKSVEWSEEERSGRTIEVRTLKEVKTYDVGPVTFPAYESAAAGLRSEEAERDVWREELGKNERRRQEMEIRERELELDSETGSV